jgi:hypothetical protein
MTPAFFGGLVTRLRQKLRRYNICTKLFSTPVKQFHTAAVVSIINLIFKNTPVTYFMQRLSQRKNSQEKRLSAQYSNFLIGCLKKYSAFSLA